MGRPGQLVVGGGFGAVGGGVLGGRFADVMAAPHARPPRRGRAPMGKASFKPVVGLRRGERTMAITARPTALPI
jgi:hypothetical protein